MVDFVLIYLFDLSCAICFSSMPGFFLKLISDMYRTVNIYIYIYLFIYLFREKERETDRQRERDRQTYRY